MNFKTHGAAVWLPLKAEFFKVLTLARSLTREPPFFCRIRLSIIFIRD